MQLETNARMLAWLSQTFETALQRGSADPIRKVYSLEKVSSFIPDSSSTLMRSIFPIVRALFQDGRALSEANLAVEEQSRYCKITRQFHNDEDFIFKLLACKVITDKGLVDSLMDRARNGKMLEDEDKMLREVRLARFVTLGEYSATELSDPIKERVRNTLLAFGPNFIKAIYGTNQNRLSNNIAIDVHSQKCPTPFVQAVLEEEFPGLCLRATIYNPPVDLEEKATYDENFETWVAQAISKAAQRGQWTDELGLTLVANIGDPNRFLGLVGKFGEISPIFPQYFMRAVEEYYQNLEIVNYNSALPVNTDTVDKLLAWADILERNPDFCTLFVIENLDRESILSTIENRLPIDVEIAYRGVENISLERWQVVLDGSDVLVSDAEAVDAAINLLIEGADKVPAEIIREVFSRNHMGRVVKAIDNYRNDDGERILHEFNELTDAVFLGEPSGVDLVVGHAGFSGEAADKITLLAVRCYQETLAQLISQSRNTPSREVAPTQEWAPYFLENFFNSGRPLEGRIHGSNAAVVAALELGGRTSTLATPGQPPVASPFNILR